ncbi:hypothetical protein JCM21900_000395 [Sporobolomyces salmonicolor]
MSLPYYGQATPSHSSTRSHRTGPPASLALSPVSVGDYSKVDSFLSPNLSNSRLGSPASLHPPSSPRSPSVYHPSAPLGSPGLQDPPGGFLGQLAIPPTAKRARSRTWAVLAGGCILVLTGMLALGRGGPRSVTLEAYSSRVGDGLEKWREWSGAWTRPEGQPGTSETVVAADEEAPLLGSRLDLSATDPLNSEPNVDEVVETGAISITTLPHPRLPDKDDPSARYLGFLPHSGYHNQRIALQNALLLGKLLNRTVLVPPVWIGWPVSTQHYDDLRETWLNIMLLNPASFNLSTLTADSPLNLPADFPSTITSFPCPSCSADNATLVTQNAAAIAAKHAKWAAMGYELRPDGYPKTNLTASECKSYSPECRHSYLDTFLAWDFLVDLDEAKKTGVDVVDRWDVRENALLTLLNVTKEDIVSRSALSYSAAFAPASPFYFLKYVLKDRQPYDFRFADRGMNASSPLIQPDLSPSHWNRDVSLPTLETLSHKVVLLGSLFGSGRIQSSHTSAHNWSEAFGRAMAFKNEWLLRPANAIVERLGGQSNFVGVHARVGDGEFARHARQNMEMAWRELVGEKMGVLQEVLEVMWEKVKPAELGEPMRVGATASGNKRHASALEKVRRKWSTGIPVLPRSPWADLDGDELDAESTSEQPTSHAKRGLANSVWHLLSLDADPSSRLRNLTCRAPLHTDARFKPFNTPLYLATDSRSPTLDPNLETFFAAFPCTFILSDFDRPDAERNQGGVVKSIGEMGRLVNALDDVPLGRLFLPFLEAIIAAKGRLTVGTLHSTFSGFAQGDLHEAYWTED